MRTYNATGIVLKRGDYRENDRLFTILTREYGKIEVVAKGTKKILSKLNPHLEPGHVVRIMVAQGRGYDKLANATVVEHFPVLRDAEDILLRVQFQFMLELTDRLVLETDPDPSIYDLLTLTLRTINAQDDEWGTRAVSYTHLTLPTIYSV